MTDFWFLGELYFQYLWLIIHLNCIHNCPGYDVFGAVLKCTKMKTVDQWIDKNWCVHEGILQCVRGLLLLACNFNLQTECTNFTSRPTNLEPNQWVNRALVTFDCLFVLSLDRLCVENCAGWCRRRVYMAWSWLAVGLSCTACLPQSVPPAAVEMLWCK